MVGDVAIHIICAEDLAVCQPAAARTRKAPVATWIIVRIAAGARDGHALIRPRAAAAMAWIDGHCKRGGGGDAVPGGGGAAAMETVS